MGHAPALRPLIVAGPPRPASARPNTFRERPSLMSEHFDAIVIGSGFGGAVMTYRLAEAGLRVCLLERAEAFPPNSFPRYPYGLRNNFWDPSIRRARRKSASR